MGSATRGSEICSRHGALSFEAPLVADLFSERQAAAQIREGLFFSHGLLEFLLSGKRFQDVPKY